jgi:hypothetical protein
MPSNEDALNFEIYRMCREEGKHEFDILAGRLNTFMTSQAFLVSAYAVSMNNTNESWGHAYKMTFPTLLSLMGLILSARAVPGIIAACGMIHHWHNRQDGLLASDGELQKYYALQPKEQAHIHARDIWFAQTSPYIFGVAWVVFGCLSLYFGLLHS